MRQNQLPPSLPVALIPRVKLQKTDSTPESLNVIINGLVSGWRGFPVLFPSPKALEEASVGPDFGNCVTLAHG